MIATMRVDTRIGKDVNHAWGAGRRNLFETAGGLRMPVVGIALVLMICFWPLSSNGADPADVEDFLATGSCPGCDLSGAFLDTVDAKGGDLWNANLNNASLYYADLTQADLYGADLSGADLKYASLDGADLRNARMNKADLTGATLNFADILGLQTSGKTTCPDGTAGPCDFSGRNQ